MGIYDEHGGFRSSRMNVPAQYAISGVPDSEKGKLDAEDYAFIERVKEDIKKAKATGIEYVNVSIPDFWFMRRFAVAATEMLCKATGGFGRHCLFCYVCIVCGWRSRQTRLSACW